MLKRTWAIVLSLVMLVALCPTTSVFAASKTDNLITEDFEDGNYDAITELNASNGYTATKSVADGVLKVTDLNNAAGLGFSVSEAILSENDVFLSYDIQFSKIPTNINDEKDIYLCGAESTGGRAPMKARQLTVDGKTDYYISYTDGTWQNGVPVEEGKWYKMYYVRDNGIMLAALANENGEILCAVRRAGQGTTQTTFSIVRGSADALGDGEILIDNVKFNWFSHSTYGPAVSQCFIDRMEDGTVSRNAKSALVVFDQAITTNPTATLTAADGTEISCTVTKEFNKDFSSAFVYGVAWTADLVPGTSYTLTLSGNNAQSVAIDSTGIISFTTEEATLAETVLRDGFEDANEFSSNLYDRDYSKPFSSGSTVHGAYQVTGYNGTGSAIEVRYDQSNSTGTRATLYSSTPYVFGANNAVVVTYKMKISNAAVDGTEGAYTGGNNIWIGTSVTNGQEVKSGHVLAAIDLDGYTGEHYIGKGSNSSVSSLAGKQGYYYDEDKWYNVTFTVDAGKETFTLSDIDTGEVLWNHSKEFSYTSSDGYYIGIVSMNTRKNGENGSGAAVTIDDIALWKIDTSKATHALTASATANENAVTLTFNQPTTITADMLAVSTDSEGNEKVDADIDVKYTDFNTNVVTINGLDYGESYYLDYSAVTSAGDAAIASSEQATSRVAFTVPEPTTSLMDKAAYDENGKVTFDYWAKAGENTATFIAAFYKGTTLVDTALAKDYTLSGTETAVEFTAADVPADADGMIVYALNSIGTLVPLCLPTGKVSIN